MEEKTRSEPEIFSAHPEVRLARIAAKQHGVASRRQLIAIGIDDAAIRVRVARAASTGCTRVFTQSGMCRARADARWMAAVVACGQGAFLSHPDAAVLWGFYDRIGLRIHVTVKWRRSVEGLVIHRTRRLDPDEATTRNGIPVTTVARTFVDLTDCVNEDRLLRAMREAEFKNLLDLDSLNAAVERAHGRRRLTPLKRAIALHRPGQIVRGELEHRFAELRRGSGLREPQTNFPITARGRTYILDCYWPEHRLAVELDGRDAHAREMAFESDRRRDAALNAIGVRLLRFTWQRVNYDGPELLADLTAAMNLSNSS